MTPTDEMTELAQEVWDQGWRKAYVACILNEFGTYSLEVEVLPTDIIATTWDTETDVVYFANQYREQLEYHLLRQGFTVYTDRDEWESIGDD